MQKEQVLELVRSYGDAIINYRSAESKKAKYNVCTLDFDNEYIKQKHNRAKETDDTALMFCWDVDAYRLLKVENITSVQPLAGALKDGRNVR